MRSLLLAGLGPEIKNADYLAGSLFDTEAPQSESLHMLEQKAGLHDLRIEDSKKRMPLLRPATSAMPDLTSIVLAAVLDEAGEDYQVGDISRIWAGLPPDVEGPFDVVLLSTTFIWNYDALSRAVRWAEAYFPSTILICGGQYSNLKYRQIMGRHESIKFIIRGDAEASLPALLHTLARKESVETVPNLVFRNDDTGSIIETRTANIDFELSPSPMPKYPTPVMPYESMRGCPFRCKFCSFPFASPQWRYKSAEKMWRDWHVYADDFGTVMVKSMDSTFTVPPTRMRDFMRLMPIPNLRWQAYSRANTIRSAEYVDRLAGSGCDSLSIGFESMSESSLESMNKKVRVSDNRRAFDLLNGSPIGYKISFMAGYPGETPEDYLLTDEFLVNEYEGYFLLSVFSISDETMPVWEDADRFQLKVTCPDPDDPDWEHIGMSSATARELVCGTLDRVRRNNDRAVHNLWQQRYDTPLMPGAARRINLQLEKAVERIAMAPKDFATDSRRIEEIEKQKEVLFGLGVQAGQVDMARAGSEAR